MYYQPNWARDYFDTSSFTPLKFSYSGKSLLTTMWGDAGLSMGITQASGIESLGFPRSGPWRKLWSLLKETLNLFRCQKIQVWVFHMLNLCNSFWKLDLPAVKQSWLTYISDKSITGLKEFLKENPSPILIESWNRVPFLFGETKLFDKTRSWQWWNCTASLGCS